MIKETKLLTLLVFMYSHPGCTRKEIREGTGLTSYLLNMYLSSYYGYQEGSYKSGTFNNITKKNDPERKSYFRTADYKPAKGRIIHTYYLNEAGQKKVEDYGDLVMRQLMMM